MISSTNSKRWRRLRAKKSLNLVILTVMVPVIVRSFPRLKKDIMSYRYGHLRLHRLQMTAHRTLHLRCEDSFHWVCLLRCLHFAVITHQRAESAAVSRRQASEIGFFSLAAAVRQNQTRLISSRHQTIFSHRRQNTTTHQTIQHVQRLQRRSTRRVSTLMKCIAGKTRSFHNDHR